MQERVWGDNSLIFASPAHVDGVVVVFINLRSTYGVRVYILLGRRYVRAAKAVKKGGRKFNTGHCTCISIVRSA